MASIAKQSAAPLTSHLVNLPYEIRNMNYIYSVVKPSERAVGRLGDCDSKNRTLQHHSCSDGCVCDEDDHCCRIVSCIMDDVGFCANQTLLLRRRFRKYKTWQRAAHRPWVEWPRHLGLPTRVLVLDNDCEAPFACEHARLCMEPGSTSTAAWWTGTREPWFVQRSLFRGWMERPLDKPHGLP